MFLTQRKWTLVSIFLVFLFLFISVSSQAELAVAPLSIIVDLQPGESTTEQLSIHNTGEDPIEVNVELMDWWRSPEGNFEIKNPGTLKKSCADWVLFSPSSLSLQPGERKQVSVELSVPENATGDHWALLLASEKPQPVEEEQPVTTRISVSYAIKILQKDPANRLKEAKITNIELSQSLPLELKITYKNSGSAHLQTTGRVEIRNLEGDTVKSFEVDKFPTLPGEERIITIKEKTEGESLSPGQYYAIVVLDFGGDHLIQGGLPIEIPEEKENLKE